MKRSGPWEYIYSQISDRMAVGNSVVSKHPLRPNEFGRRFWSEIWPLFVVSFRPFPNLIFDIVQRERLISFTFPFLGKINRHDILLPYVIYRSVCFVFSFK